jgi:hypothetical protein
MNADYYDAIDALDDTFKVTEHAFRKCGLNDDIEFLPVGRGYLILGVEWGMHGDYGINGSCGSPKQFAASVCQQRLGAHPRSDDLRREIRLRPLGQVGPGL